MSTLALDRPVHGEHPAVLRSAWQALPQAPLVLVVDDDEDTCAAVSSMLLAEGLRVARAGTAASALALAAALPVAAVVLDVVLPDRTGFDVCRALKQNPGTAHVPVVLLTALYRLSDEATGVLAGADGYLSKPATRARLRAQLLDLL